MSNMTEQDRELLLKIAKGYDELKHRIEAIEKNPGQLPRMEQGISKWNVDFTDPLSMAAWRSGAYFTFREGLDNLLRTYGIKRIEGYHQRK